MVNNLLKAGASVVVYDPDQSALKAASEVGATVAESCADVARRAPVVLTAVPNDKVLHQVVVDLLPALPKGAVHVSCSTVAPKTSRALGEEHAAKGVGFVSAPVFARPDGMRRGEATIPISGASWAKDLAKPALQHTSLEVHDFGEDVGAANVVKLGGNFLIAAAIESLAEASALAESNGVDREQFVSLMSSTIFDCLIYKGYGHRVATRDHFPHPDAHFALDLGTKDVALIHDSASDSRCPMPIASLLRDRFVAAQNSGRGKLDWSALALRASEDAGVDVGPELEKLLASTK
jgi:3-hydroxyisobutyrate dehydrogenase-like beta-hydroxyacid dehydrogenase